MVTCLGLIADACVAGVLSQGLEMITVSSGDLRVLLVVLGCSLFFGLFVCALGCACMVQELCIISVFECKHNF